MCHREDGSLWRLGAGSFGTVLHKLVNDVFCLTFQACPTLLPSRSLGRLETLDNQICDWVDILNSSIGVTTSAALVQVFKAMKHGVQPVAVKVCASGYCCLCMV